MSKHLENQKVLVFIPTHNAEGKKDVTYAFLPEAKEFIKLAKAGSELIQFDNSKPLPARRKFVGQCIESRINKGFTSVAFMCHGWLNGMQAGYTRQQAPELAGLIHKLVNSPPNVVKTDVIVPLFCCSTGDDPQNDPITAAGTGDDSFADKLRDALCQVGQVNCRTMGHTTVAHTTKNPMVLFMDGMGVPDGGVGGYPPVSPKSAAWKLWRKALQKTSLRFRMPYMTAAEIHAELSAGSDALV